MAYSAVEKRKKGDVLRKARAEGSAARARAPTSVLTMMWVEMCVGEVAHDRPELAAVSIGRTLGMTRWPM